MSSIIATVWPEVLLIVVGCALLLLGVINRASARRLAPLAALAALALVFAALWWGGQPAEHLADPWGTTFVYRFQQYVKLIAAGAGVMLVLLAWPTNPDATGNPALQFGHEAGEFFGLMLLSIAGILFVASANDIILLFLAIELASIPTYVLVSISRPLPVAQEAGVKYFFLGAMAAAVMLFGFSYLYGTSGQTQFELIAGALRLNEPGHDWQLLAIVMLVLGFSFKIAAVPLHAYAGDVYQGAATPVTALLAFVPKASGFVALLKVLFYAGLTPGGESWALPDAVAKLLWAMAVLTMFAGNVLGLLQYNVKRVLAYSSIAHSGYMLVGVTVLVTAVGHPAIQQAALAGVLFYLAAYAVMNMGTFGVLTMLPSRESGVGGYLDSLADEPAATSAAAVGNSAETFDDLAGQGRRHLALGLAMTICCLGLAGIPFTVGFLGKVFIIRPALDLTGPGVDPAVSRRMWWLVVLTMVNAAISAAYYLRIVAAMFVRAEPAHGAAPAPGVEADYAAAGGVYQWRVAAYGPGMRSRPWPILVGIAISVFGTLLFGLAYPAADALTNRTLSAQISDRIQPSPGPAAGGTPATSALAQSK